MSSNPQSRPRAPFSVTLRHWERADDAGILLPLTGRRAVLVNRDGSHHDHRVAGEIRRSAGELVVDVVSEEAWVRYRLLAMRMEPIRWPAAAVWVEVD